jgi:hypothetical protein
MTAAEIGATVNFLDDLLTIRRAKDDKAPAPTVNETAPPPPAPLTISELVTEYAPADDIDVETDGESVTAVTVSTELPVPPPPPPVPRTDANGFGTDNIYPAPPGPAVTPELDIKGTPWDGRVHAANRAKKIDGTWKNKRGLENKAGNAPITTAATATTPSALTATVPPPPPAPAAPSIATPSVPPSTGPAALLDFRGLMKKIQEATAANKLTADQVNGALEGCGLKPEEMAQLINNAPLIASVNAAIDACLTT